jgi:TRAP-type transport system small permease protein
VGSREEERLSVLKKLNDGVEKVAGVGLVFFMAVMAITIPITVFCRYVLRNTPTWTDETALFSLAWASMLGAAVGLRKGYQVGIRSLVEKAPKVLSAAMQIVGYLFMFVLFGVLIVYGTRQTITNMRQLSPAMQIPMGLPYLALPLGFLIMFLFTLEEALVFFTGLRGKKEA